MRVVPVTPTSSHFAGVLALGRRESRTLGLMPEGGFREGAESGGLLAAEAPDGSTAGYVLFRTTPRATSITHLCIAKDHRGSGVARLLFEAVKVVAAGGQEVRLTCRRDYDANLMWPKLGFVAAGERQAKREGARLTVWRYDLQPLPLLRLAEELQLLPVAVIDANVFFDLDDVEPGQEESRGLAADWLTDAVDLAITPELFNEIDRRADQGDRDRQRARARLFRCLTRHVEREEVVFAEVATILPKDSRPSSRSDARQVAMAVAAGMTLFVTRDGAILNVAETLYDRFDLRVMPPHELILNFDELRREDAYRPRRLFLGPDMKSVSPRAEDVDRLVAILHDGHVPPEPRLQTTARIKDMLADPVRFPATCIEQGGELLAAYFVSRETDALTIPYFAVAPSPLGRTAARHFADHFVEMAAKEGRHLVRLVSACERVAGALEALGFSNEGGTWMKIAIGVTVPPTLAAIEVERVGAFHPEAANLTARFANELRAIADGPRIARTRVSLVEQALWPAKLTETNLPCFIVPIQPRWAKHLFDQELAFGTLFGADPKLALNSENVYYRSARPAVLSAPGRILWYVSDDKYYPDARAIRACSYLHEVFVGPPKEAYKRFRRLGVYTWSDVFGVAKNDLSRPIMAFRFGRTQLLPSPVAWKDAQKILGNHSGKGSPIASPVAIAEPCFIDLYRAGLGFNAA